MTTDEAIASLKALCHTCKHFPTCVNDKPECFQAIDMAIKSLEAWEKVKEEIKYHADNIRYTDAYRDGFEVSLKIIDKHLSEVSE